MSDLPHVIAGFGIGTAALNTAIAYQQDQIVYGEVTAKALQEMATATPWDRATWINAWTSSRVYRRAWERGEAPDVTAWLAAIRERTGSMSIPQAIRELDKEAS